jgi:hypothetical protein
MSKTSLNQTNLSALGAGPLAHLLIEVTTGNADLQRRLRLELSAAQGLSELSRELRKRLAALRRAKTRVSWRKRRKLAQELDLLCDMIVHRVGGDDPSEAFDLLWEFLDLEPAIQNRTDDSREEIAEAFARAVAHFETLGPKASPDATELAERLFEALFDNAAGQSDGMITALGPTLGQTGLDHLAGLTRARIETRAPHSIARGRGLLVLQQIADIQGDVAGFMARYTAQELRLPQIALEVAERFVRVNDAARALELLVASGEAQTHRNPLQPEMDALRITCLDALGRGAQAQALRWESFRTHLNGEHLRAYLAALPDFEDIEAEDRAKDHAMGFSRFGVALDFFLNRGDLALAARLIETRAKELNGHAEELLERAANMLGERHPLAAVLARRALILFALHDGRTKRYGQAAGHLLECFAADALIVEYAPFPDHDVFVRSLEEWHGSKKTFWQRVR